MALAQHSSSKKFQHGLSLSQLLIGCVVIGGVVLLLAKVVPDYIVYYKVKEDVTAVAQEANANPNATVDSVRVGFDKRAEIDEIHTVAGADLDVSKDPSGKIVVAFEYERKIPLFRNISLLINFEGSSAK
ncbi:MAG TPA: DUF4845 domain-containing protein [Rhodocyclaceae bacterium]|nr:DUF4845 domain-containing protein [Rhodocyclaceae bacterium]